VFNYYIKINENIFYDNMIEYTINIDNIEENNIILKKPIKNQNNRYINYYKLIYSNSIFNLKYILLNLNFQNYSIIFKSNIYKLVLYNNDPLYDKLEHIEKTILTVLQKNINKKIHLKIKKELLEKEFIYNFTHFPNLKQLFMKISGIWENHNEIGLVYKIYYNTSTEKLSNINC
jgi:hypothetical protein